MTEKKNTRFSGVLNRSVFIPEPELPPEPKEAAAAPLLKTGRAPGKKTDPNYTQVTVYLRKDVHNTARKLLIDEHRQFSDLVGALVSEWLDRRKSGLPNF